MIHRTGYHTNHHPLFLFAALTLATGIFFACGLLTQSDACTNILVSRGASADGSVFVSFSVQKRQFVMFLLFRCFVHVHAARPFSTWALVLPLLNFFQHASQSAAPVNKN